MKYRKKPIVIEAWQNIEGQPVPDWVSSSSKRLSDGRFLIRTLEGVMTADVGDYIIFGINQEVYPCKPDIFEKSYERAD